MSYDDDWKDGLPPPMGFSQEEYVAPDFVTGFYTCVVGPFRVFVWESFRDLWLLQLGINGGSSEIAKQFTGTDTKHYEIEGRDALALKAIIYDLTSEGNEDEPAHTTGATDSIPPLHI